MIMLLRVELCGGVEGGVWIILCVKLIFICVCIGCHMFFVYEKYLKKYEMLYHKIINRKLRYNYI